MDEPHTVAHHAREQIVVIPLLQRMGTRLSDYAHSRLVRRVLERDHGVREIAEFKRDQWHLGSRYYSGVLADTHGRVFIKQGPRAMIANEMHVWRQIATAGGKNMLASMIAANEAGAVPFIICEWIDGGMLTDALERRDRVVLQAAARKLVELVDILHDANVVHRDIRPGNLMIRDAQASLVVIDFALAVTDGPSPDAYIPYESLLVLGDRWNPEPLVWDDAYSALLIVRYMERLCASHFKEAADLERRVGRLEYRHETARSLEVARQ